MTLLRLLDRGKRIINVDETWLNETSFVRKVWACGDGQGNIKLNAVTPRLSMIAAIDTNGKVWFSLSHANTDCDVMAVFFQHLVQALDLDEPGWQDNTIFLLDNATYHWSSDTAKIFHQLGLQILYSGPYSFSAAPAETLFS